jgi:hypothetical protein
MENVAHAGAIAKMQQKQSAHPVPSWPHAVLTPLLCKSHTEFGEAYQKMIA